MARSCPSVWRKISDRSILMRSSSLTKLKFGAMKFLSAEIQKKKSIIRNETF